MGVYTVCTMKDSEEGQTATARKLVKGLAQELAQRALLLICLGMLTAIAPIRFFWISIYIFQAMCFRQKGGRRSGCGRGGQICFRKLNSRAFCGKRTALLALSARSPAKRASSASSRGTSLSAARLVPAARAVRWWRARARQDTSAPPLLLKRRAALSKTTPRRFQFAFPAGSAWPNLSRRTGTWPALLCEARFPKRANPTTPFQS